AAGRRRPLSAGGRRRVARAARTCAPASRRVRPRGVDGGARTRARPMSSRPRPSVIESFNYAIEGVVHVLRTQRNMRIHFVVAAADKTASVLDKVRDAPARITLIALILTVIVVIATKAWTGRGTPLRGGLPSGHAAVGFACWIAATYVVTDSHRFLISALT